MTIFPDFTALIIAAIVVVLALVLKTQFFEPLARAMETREATSASARNRLRNAEAAAKGANDRLEAALAAARKEGYDAMDRIRGDAAREADAVLAAADERARERIAEGRARLDEQARRAAAELEAAAADLGSELAARVLRRAS